MSEYQVTYLLIAGVLLILSWGGTGLIAFLKGKDMGPTLYAQYRSGTRWTHWLGFGQLMVLSLTLAFMPIYGNPILIPVTGGVFNGILALVLLLVRGNAMSRAFRRAERRKMARLESWRAQHPRPEVFYDAHR